MFSNMGIGRGSARFRRVRMRVTCEYLPDSHSRLLGMARGDERAEGRPLLLARPDIRGRRQTDACAEEGCPTHRSNPVPRSSLGPTGRPAPFPILLLRIPRPPCYLDGSRQRVAAAELVYPPPCRRKNANKHAPWILEARFSKRRVPFCVRCRNLPAIASLVIRSSRRFCW